MDRILLPENMFVSLMDFDLQDRIANTDRYNYDIKNALELLLENRPNSLRQDLEDWRLLGDNRTISRVLSLTNG